MQAHDLFKNLDPRGHGFPVLMRGVRTWPLALLPVLVGLEGFLGASSFPGTAFPGAAASTLKPFETNKHFRGSFCQEAAGARGRSRHATVMTDQFVEGEEGGALTGYHRVDRRLLSSLNMDQLSVKQLTLVLLHDDSQVRFADSRDLLQRPSPGKGRHTCLTSVSL